VSTKLSSKDRLQHFYLTLAFVILLDELVEVTEQVRRGRSMGKDLDRITRGLGSKICIHVSEGKRRPAVPLQAAKLASEAGIVLRQHVPIFPHWKHYKKNDLEMDNCIGKVVVSHLKN
jgi:hypothetical protein